MSAARARRGRLAALASLYAVRAFGALWIGSRVSQIAARTIGGYPNLDAGLFEPGALLLAETVRVTQPFALAFGVGAGAIGVLTAFAGLVPLAMVILSARREREATTLALVAAALEPFATLAWLEVLAFVVGALAGASVVMIGVTVRAQAGLHGPAEDACFLASGGAALALLALVGVTHDLARVVAVDERRGVYASAARAVALMQTVGVRVCRAWIWRASAAILAVVAAFVLGGAIGVGALGAIAGAAAVHQAAILLTAGWRASFLEAVVDLVAEQTLGSEAREDA